MEIIKEHRWFAPLLSVLLVCILGIGLYAEVQQTQNNHKNASMHSLSWSGNSAAPTYGDRMGTHKGSNRTSPIFVAAHGQPSWKEIMPTPLPASQMKQAEQARNNVATGKKKPEVQHSKSAILTPPTTIYFTKTKMLTQDDKALSTWSYTVSAKELLLLQK